MTAPRKPESEKLVRRDAWALPRTWKSIDDEATARNISRQYIIRERLERKIEDRHAQVVAGLKNLKYLRRTC